jgi:hypothetical protein
MEDETKIVQEEISRVFLNWIILAQNADKWQQLKW